MKLNSSSRKLLVLLPILALTACVTRPQSYETASDINLVKDLKILPEFPEWNPEDLEEQAREDVKSPINVYVKMVNPQGEPIVGLPVEYTVLNTVLEPFDYPYYGWVTQPKIFSNRNGLISIETTGAAIEAQIKTEKYWNDEGLRGLMYFAPRLQELNTFPLPNNKDQPAVLTLREKPAEAFTQNISTGAIAAPNETTIAIKLPGQQRYSAAQGDLEISVAEKLANELGRYTWSVSVVVPGGGIQVVQNLPDIYAPQNGYQSDFKYTMAAQDPQWDHRRDFYFYIKTAKGNYALVELKVRTDHDNFVVLSGNYNPYGVPIIK